MTSLWIEASYDAEADIARRRLAACRTAVLPLWSFLAAAESPEDFVNRKALVSDRIDKAAAAITEDEPANFAVLRAEVEASLDADYTVVHQARQAEAGKAAPEPEGEHEKVAAVKKTAFDDDVVPEVAADITPEADPWETDLAIQVEEVLDTEARNDLMNPKAPYNHQVTYHQDTGQYHVHDAAGRVVGQYPPDDAGRAAANTHLQQIKQVDQSRSRWDTHGSLQTEAEFPPKKDDATKPDSGGDGNPFAKKDKDPATDPDSGGDKQGGGSLDPTQMQPGTAVTLNYTLTGSGPGGGAGSVPATFDSTDGSTYYFTYDRGRFGVTQQGGKWVDSAGTEFTFDAGTDPGAQQPAQPIDSATQPAVPNQQPPVHSSVVHGSRRPFGTEAHVMGDPQDPGADHYHDAAGRVRSLPHTVDEIDPEGAWRSRRDHSVASLETEGGWSPASGMGGHETKPYKPTHSFSPIGWDQFDARPHPGSRQIAPGSKVMNHGKMDPSGHLLHIEDEHGNHQTVDKRSLQSLRKKGAYDWERGSGQYTWHPDRDGYGTLLDADSPDGGGYPVLSNGITYEDAVTHYAGGDASKVKKHDESIPITIKRQQSLQIEAVAWARRHYEDLASAISASPEREQLADHFSHALKGTNPHYREEQFKAAASTPGYRVRGGTGTANYSRGHYQRIADAVSSYPGDRDHAAEHLANHFAATSHNFDHGKFMQAAQGQSKAAAKVAEVDGPWPVDGDGPQKGEVEDWPSGTTSTDEEEDRFSKGGAQHSWTLGEGEGSLSAMSDKDLDDNLLYWQENADHLPQAQVEENLKMLRSEKSSRQSENWPTFASMQKGAPFAGYKDFEACVAANQDKDNPEAYCGKIKHQVEDGKQSSLQITADGFDDWAADKGEHSTAHVDGAEAVTSQKSARDLKVGDVVSGKGTVSKVDTTTTPGVVYVWLNGKTDPPADLTLNHGEVMKTASLRTADNRGATMDCPTCGSKAKLVKSNSKWIHRCSNCGWTGDKTTAGLQTQANPYAQSTNPYLPGGQTMRDAAPGPMDRAQSEPQPNTGPGEDMAGLPESTRPRQRPAGAPGSPGMGVPAPQPPMPAPTPGGNGADPNRGQSTASLIPVLCPDCSTRNFIRAASLLTEGDITCPTCDSPNVDLDDDFEVESGLAPLLPGGDHGVAWVKNQNERRDSYVKSAPTSDLADDHYEHAHPVKSLLPKSHWDQGEYAKSTDYANRLKDHVDNGGHAHEFTGSVPGSGLSSDHPMDTLQNVDSVKQTARCASCLHEFQVTATDPAQPLPNCPKCGSSVVSAAGAVHQGSVHHQADFFADIPDIEEPEIEADASRATGPISDEVVQRRRSQPAPDAVGSMADAIDNLMHDRWHTKATQMAQGIIAANPGLSYQAAFDLAQRTIERYPRMVEAATQR